MAPPKADTNDYRCDQHEKWIDDHEVRIRSLEKFQWKAIGIVAGISGLSGMFGAFVGVLMGK